MSDIPLPPLPPRPADAHKGTFGHVLVLAGSTRYSGAAVLAARAVLRGGAGLVTLGCPESAHAMIAARLLCEMAVPLRDDGNGTFHHLAAESALAMAGERDIVALGPGLSRQSGAVAFARDVGLRCDRTTVIDADGLNAFAGHAEELEEAAGRRILTPHPGEAARLLETAVADVLVDRERAALRLAQITGAVVLLKGAPTYVADGVTVRANETGNAGLATGGTGDVLTGLVAALCAQGLEPLPAAILGAHLHGLAGDFAAAERGQHGMTAEDVLGQLPHALREHAARTA